MCVGVRCVWVRDVCGYALLVGVRCVWVCDACVGMRCVWVSEVCGCATRVGVRCVWVCDVCGCGVFIVTCVGCDVYGMRGVVR